jgi:hypothetical protein
MNQSIAKSPLKIANAQAFWGDRNDAAAELLSQVPDLDYLTLDYLAEVSLSILAQQQARDPEAGYPKDFLELFTSLIPYWKSGGRCKLITNAGGFNPLACARACAARLVELGGPSLRIGVVSGDAVLDQLQNPQHPDAEQLFRQLETNEPLDTVRSRLVTANAYLGAASLVDALAGGADVVITGRVADPSLTVAACVHHFGWAGDDWNRWAAATVAGHLIECGVQVTGGISTDWLSLPDPANLGFPIIEMQDDGTFVVTKAPGTGGTVDLWTVAEQLVYEIGDPGRYLSPDLTVSFLGLYLEQDGQDRVRVTGASGSPPTSSYKVSATYRDGFRAAGQLTIFGRDAVEKGYRCGEIVLERMRAAGLTWRDAIVECIGAGACANGVFSTSEFATLKEVVFRIALEADDQKVVEFFTRQIIPLVTAGPQGTTGYAEGRPRVHPIFRYWPCLINRNHVTPKLEFVDAPTPTPVEFSGPYETAISFLVPLASAEKKIKGQLFSAVEGIKSGSDQSTNSSPKILRDIAIARSGDKGASANIGILCRNPWDYDKLQRWLTAKRVATFLAPIGIERVERFELPNLHGLNFLVHGILSRGLRCDVQGKTLGQVLLELPLDPDFMKGGGDE